MSENAFVDASWIETRDYPSSRFQLILSTGILFFSLTLFLIFSTGEVVVSVASFITFASLTFSVAIFPQYTEFKRMSGDLVANFMAKAQPLKGIGQIIPLVTLFLILVVLPIVLMLIAPPFLFWSSITGIIAGFASFQLVFILYVRNWAKSRGLKVCRYSVVSRNEKGKQVILEYGLRGVRV